MSVMHREKNRSPSSVAHNRNNSYLSSSLGSRREGELTSADSPLTGHTGLYTHLYHLRCQLLGTWRFCPALWACSRTLTCKATWIFHKELFLTQTVAELFLNDWTLHVFPSSLSSAAAIQMAPPQGEQGFGWTIHSNAQKWVMESIENKVMQPPLCSLLSLWFSENFRKCCQGFLKTENEVKIEKSSL